MRGKRDGGFRSSDEATVMAVERREPLMTASGDNQPNRATGREELLPQAKPFAISKVEVWEAYLAVKANRGAAGVDGQTIALFEQNLKRNLYKLWNRMASGSYFPQAVKRVEIPKADGGVRPLGIPTVGDRIAQMVVKARMEPKLEPHFHANSYGYRPGKRAHDAISMAKIRCRERDWVLDLDIKGFFDNLDHDLMMKAVRVHVQENWMLLYIERWLQAPVQLLDGSVQIPHKGTPQGGVISPLLANLYLHYTFDRWMVKSARNIRFERYADDIICHCQSLTQAEMLHRKIEARMDQCGLQLHPDKTKIVYCRDAKRREDYPRIRFDFLGHTFCPRKVRRANGTITLGFVPAISAKAAQAIRDRLRQGRFRQAITSRLVDLARQWNPVLRGWLGYYGKFYRSQLHKVLQAFDWRLAKWAGSKFKRGRASLGRGLAWVARVRKRNPHLFAHWKFFAASTNGS